MWIKEKMYIYFTIESIKNKKKKIGKEENKKEKFCSLFMDL